MEAYLMELENEINETTGEDMELKLTTPSFGNMTEEQREFNNDTTNEQDTDTNTTQTTSLLCSSNFEGWKFDFGVFGSSQSI